MAEVETKKVDKFTPGVLDNLRDNIEDALAPVGDAFGIKFGTGKVTYSEAVATLNLEMGVISASGEVSTRASEAYESYAGRYGLKVEDLGRKFTTPGGDEFTLIGAKPRNRKYPLLGRGEADGKTYKFTVSMVVQGLTRYDNAKKTV